MPTDHPTIDLRGYQRLHDLEQHVSYSPVVFVLTILGFVGLGILGYGLHAALHTPDFSFAIPLAGFGTILTVFGGLKGYLTWRWSRIKCPHCVKAMRPYVIDLTVGCRGRWVPGFEIDGHYYCQPFGDDDDRRPWVRLMKVVRACESCRTYLDCSQLHQQTCLEEDLQRIRRRLPNHERDTLRWEAWGKTFVFLWSVALIVGFFLLWWWSSHL